MSKPDGSQLGVFIERPCVICGQAVETIRGKERRTCSDACLNAWRSRLSTAYQATRRAE